MTTTHGRSALERDLEGIRADILRLGSQVERAIERSVQALKGHDTGLAQEVINHDEEINQLRYVIEEECLELIAAQAAASDALARLDVIWPEEPLPEEPASEEGSIPRRQLKLNQDTKDAKLDKLGALHILVQSIRLFSTPAQTSSSSRCHLP